MEEENKPEEKQTDAVRPMTEEKYMTTPLIERAREEREKLEAANKKKEELLEREEQLLSKRILGGQAEAGAEPEKKEETPAEYKERILRGELNERERI